MSDRYRNRYEAGAALAHLLEHHRGDASLSVLALPRGGVPVGFAVAQALHAPLDVFVVRKLGMIGHEEFALGAIASGGKMVLNAEAIRGLNVSPETIHEIAAREEGELKRREALFRGERPPLNVRERKVILVDDGLATGSTMRVAVEAVRQMHPKSIIVAVPVGAVDSCCDIQASVDEFYCVRTPEPFVAVGQWYEDFAQTTDEEVRELLQRASEFAPPS